MVLLVCWASQEEQADVAWLSEGGPGYSKDRSGLTAFPPFQTGQAPFNASGFPVLG